MIKNLFQNNDPKNKKREYDCYCSVALNKTSGRQLKQRNQLSILRQDDCKTEKDIT